MNKYVPTHRNLREQDLYLYCWSVDRRKHGDIRYAIREQTSPTFGTDREWLNTSRVWSSTNREDWRCNGIWMVLVVDRALFGCTTLWKFQKIRTILIILLLLPIGLWRIAETFGIHLISYSSYLKKFSLSYPLSCTFRNIWNDFKSQSNI